MGAMCIPHSSANIILVKEFSCNRSAEGSKLLDQKSICTSSLVEIFGWDHQLSSKTGIVFPVNTKFLMNWGIKFQSDIFDPHTAVWSSYSDYRKINCYMEKELNEKLHQILMNHSILSVENAL